MEQIGKFNAISEKLRSSLVHLKPGQTVTFELLNYNTDHITGRPLFGGIIELPGRDRIRDGETFVEIGIPRVIEGDKVRKTDGFILGGGSDEAVAPRFDLSGDNIKHCEWYLFFQLCNYNQSNPNASSDKVKLIKQHDEVAEAKKTIAKTNTKLEALNMASNLTSEDARIMAAALNFNTSGVGIDPIRASLMSYADKNPETFLDVASDKNTEIKACIKLAIDKGILILDRPSYSLKWGNTGNVAVKMDEQEGKDHLQVAVETLAFMKDGATIVTQIKSQLDKKGNASSRGK